MMHSEDRDVSSHRAMGEGEVVLGAYFDAELDGSLFGDSSDEDDIAQQPTITRNADPIEEPKPEVEYEKKVPGPSTIIANISYRRVDRVTPEQARRKDACLPCGKDTTSHPNLELYELPCHHAWCRECLSRAFHFTLHHHAFKRLQCCTEKEIPLKYFERIVVDRQHPAAEYETQATGADAETDDPLRQHAMPGLRDWNPVRVTEYVEKEKEIFISTGDMLSYRILLEEFETLPRSRLYCYGKGCGRFIPKACRTKTFGECPNCGRKTCVRCRKNTGSHVNKVSKCTAGKARLEVVRNETKLLSLARRKHWKRCPRCGIFVSKAPGGCSSVVCRCGRLFFYGY